MAGLALSACAAGGALPAPDAVPEAEARLAASDGSEVAVTRWGPAEPRAILLALHGYGDHGRSTFHRAAAFWAEEGIATVAPDQRGFGRNPSRGKWPGADGLIDDAAGFADALRAENPCTPLVLLGHSMGGGVALAAAGRGLPLDGLILATPAIWGGERLNPMHRFAAWFAALVVPDQRFSGRGVVRIQASDNIEALRALGQDPLYLSPPSPREIFGLVRITDRAHAAAPKVDLPALMLLGAKDQIVPNPAVRQVFEGLKGPRRVIEYPKGWHLIFRDLQAEQVWTDVAEWIGQLPSKPGCRP
ncbi:MAG: alpha/beta fold hydrolase [Pseudomonadota bacterium]